MIYISIATAVPQMLISIFVSYLVGVSVQEVDAVTRVGRLALAHPPSKRVSYKKAATIIMIKKTTE